MKILLQLDELTAGFIQPLKDDGHEVVWWDKEAPFDIFDVVKPDVVVLTHSRLDGATLKRLGEYEEKLPMVVATQEPSQLLFHAVNFPHTLNKYSGVIINAVVDDNIFKPGKYKEDLASDLSMIGLPNTNVQKLLFPVNKYNIKIFGPKRWHNVVQYLGGVNIEEQKNIYRSAHLCYADCPQEAVKIVACGGCAISLETDVEASLGEHFMATDIDHLVSILSDKNKEERKSKQEDICGKLTYKHVYEDLKGYGVL